MKFRKLLLLGLMLSLLVGCSNQSKIDSTRIDPTNPPVSSTAEVSPTAEPVLSPTTESLSIDDLRIWISPFVPAQLLKADPLFESIKRLSQEEEANLRLAPVSANDPGIDWIYALVVPFPIIMDEISSDAFMEAWKGHPPEMFSGKPLLLTQETSNVLETKFGKPGEGAVKILPESELINHSWADRPGWAIVPFEKLEPRWKVLVIDGQSPIHKDFNPANYPLTIRFGWQGEEQAMQLVEAATLNKTLPTLLSNRDPEKMTVLVMTGVTALVRATAAKMEEKGMTYPAQDIASWLQDADLTHISNEVSFSPVCPPPNPGQTALIFCSDPRYIELLDFVGTDILELTGNHGVDWGRDALQYSLELYKERGWAYYAAGENEEKAKAPVLLEDHGNKIAFIGCNPAGPAFIWATSELSGVANCDYPWMEAEIQKLKGEGYLVIATYQYFETYRAYVEPFEERDFRRLSDAGADIVSGSQAHHPMAMEFYNNKLIHYGLGNLFFDQQFYVTPDGRKIPETRYEFIDRHVIYDQKHISTELLTAMLEDYAKPRPMTNEERTMFLDMIFTAAGW